MRTNDNYRVPHDTGGAADQYVSARSTRVRTEFPDIQPDGGYAQATFFAFAFLIGIVGFAVIGLGAVIGAIAFGVRLLWS